MSFSYLALWAFIPSPRVCFSTQWTCAPAGIAVLRLVSSSLGQRKGCWTLVSFSGTQTRVLLRKEIEIKNNKDYLDYRQ